MRQLFFLLSLTVAFCSCKKDDKSITPPSAFANSPTCAYYSYEPIGGGQYGHFVSFFDLRSTNTAEKKYFKMQLKYQGVIDSFEIAGQPQSINNLAAGFPSDITGHPGFGWVNQWTNPQFRLLTSGGSSYYKDTIVRNPASNIYHLYLNYLSGPLQGEWPQSHFDNFYEPLGINGETRLHFRTIFYFKKGLCLDANNIDPIATIKPLNSFFVGAPAYDWENVSTAIQLSTSTAGANNFYFLDFKNWRFFKWEQYMNPIFSPAQLTTEFGDYQSLDNLFNWPEGWGKP